MLGKKSGFWGMMDCYIRFITEIGPSFLDPACPRLRLKYSNYTVPVFF